MHQTPNLSLVDVTTPLLMHKYVCYRKVIMGWKPFSSRRTSTSTRRRGRARPETNYWEPRWETQLHDNTLKEEYTLPETTLILRPKHREKQTLTNNVKHIVMLVVEVSRKSKSKTEELQKTKPPEPDAYKATMPSVWCTHNKSFKRENWNCKGRKHYELEKENIVLYQLSIS